MLRRGSICYIRLTNVICAIKVTLFSQHFNEIGITPILWMTNLRNRLKLKSCCPPIWPGEFSLGHHFPSYPALSESGAPAQPCSSSQGPEPTSQEIKRAVTSTTEKFALNRLSWHHKKLTERKKSSTPSWHAITQTITLPLPTAPCQLLSCFPAFGKYVSQLSHAAQVPKYRKLKKIPV